MKSSELMKKDIECCQQGDRVTRVAQRMQSRNIGFMPVCDGRGAVVGTLTDRDLAIRVLGDQRPVDSTTAADVMTSECICCRPDDDLSVVEQLMSKHKISRVVCVDQYKKPVGVISLSDIAEVESHGKASAVLRSVSQREARP